MSKPKQKNIPQTQEIELPPLLPVKDLFALMRLLREAKNIVICGHRNPDGDALGAALGWASYLYSLGKHVACVMPNAFPDFLKWLPGWKRVLLFDRQRDESCRLLREADLICCLDFNAPNRLQEMGSIVEKSKVPRLLVDHHLDPQKEMFSQVVSFPAMSSTCEIVVRLIDQLGGFGNLRKQAAISLYTGMMTDTGAFTYNSNRPELFLAVAKLLTKGFDKDLIYRNIYHCFSQNRLRLQGYILNEKLEFLVEGKASLFTMTREEMKRFSFIRGDSEGLVNLPLQVKGLQLSISLREDTEKDVVRISLRSVGDLPCNELAEQYFHGGGHKNASGGELLFPLEEAVATTRRAVEEFFKQHEPAETPEPASNETSGQP